MRNRGTLLSQLTNLGLLSGIKHQTHFQKLRNHPRAFPDLELTTRDYETAAAFFNLCRGKGIQ